MTDQEELDWYYDQVTKKRRELDKMRQAFFELDAEVSRLERERSAVFHKVCNKRPASKVTNGERQSG